MLRVAPALLVALSVLVASACGTDGAPAQAYSGYTVDPPPDVSGVSLPVAGGDTPHEFAAEPGGLEVVYFGFTFCPDVCPTTMSDLRTAIGELDEDERGRVSVSMATIDPGRDTDEVIADYVHTFLPDAVALRTDDQEMLRAATSAFGASYEVSTDDEGEVEVTHTGELYAVSDDGTVVMQWPFGTSREALARDLSGLLDDAEERA